MVINGGEKDDKTLEDTGTFADFSITDLVEYIADNTEDEDDEEDDDA